MILLMLQLVAETFDDEAALKRWAIGTGAHVLPDVPSTASIDAGTLKLEADGKTTLWLALTRTVPLNEAKWVRLTARMRTDEVKAEGARFKNCNLFVRLGPLQGTRVLTGTNDWTAVARRWPVPEGTREVTVGCFLSMPGRAWFDDVKLEPVDPPDWQTARTEHYDYRWLAGDDVPEEARRSNEESYRLVADFLGVKDGPRATFTKYADRATKEEFTGNGGNAHRRGAEIHSIWTRDRHEIVHVLADAWGEAGSVLMGEGLAVFLSGGWQGRPVKEAARRVLDEGRWVSLEDLAKDFRSKPDIDTYAIAGALVEWLEATRSREALREQYRRLTLDLTEADAALRKHVAEEP